MEYCCECRGCMMLFSVYLREEVNTVTHSKCGGVALVVGPMGGRGRSAKRANNIIGDIEPYKSVIDGSVISGRRQHRDHLRAHGCIEVGNEKLSSSSPNNAPMSRAGHDIVRAMEQAR